MKSSRTTLGIGELARLAECRVDTIRYYERIGLMPKAERTGGKQRRYNEHQARQLVFIRRLRDLGFSVEEASGFLAMRRQDSYGCADSSGSQTAGLPKFDSRSADCGVLNAVFATSAPIAPRAPTRTAASSRRYGARTCSILNLQPRAASVVPLRVGKRPVAELPPHRGCGYQLRYRGNLVTLMRRGEGPLTTPSRSPRTSRTAGVGHEEGRRWHD
jgi:DNA-binding transcriptional MerR regulator